MRTISLADSLILLFYIVIPIVSIICVCFLSICTTKKCNWNYNKANDYSKLEIDYPEYKVQEIHERSCNNQGPYMAEYVLWNFYLKGKGNVKHQELIIYDEVGKYNVGDILVFTKLEK